MYVNFTQFLWKSVESNFLQFSHCAKGKNEIQHLLKSDEEVNTIFLQRNLKLEWRFVFLTYRTFDIWAKNKYVTPLDLFRKIQINNFQFH